MEEECVICGGEMEEKEMDKDKERRIKANAPHFEGTEFVKMICTKCGHVSYHRKKK